MSKEWWHLSRQQTNVWLKISETVGGGLVLANLIARTHFILTQSGNVSVNEVFETNIKNGIFCI